MKTNKYHEPCAEDEWIEISRKLHDINDGDETPTQEVSGTNLFVFIIYPLIMLLVLPLFLIIGGITVAQSVKMGIAMATITLIAAIIARGLVK